MPATQSTHLSDPASISAGELVKSPGVARIIRCDDSHGCTLTNASIKGLTPAEFEALGNKEVDLARVIASSAEAAMLGVQERGLVSLINSSITNIKPLINKVNVAEQSIILPYIQRRQRSLMNANYFVISSGAEADGNSPIDASYTLNSGVDWMVTVNLGASDWVTPVDKIERYFLPGGYVVVNWWDSSGDVVEVQFKIIGADNVGTPGTITEANVTLRPIGPDIVDGIVDAAWDNFAGKADYRPGYGTLQTVANNVNDFESWCRNQPTDLSVSLAKSTKPTERPWLRSCRARSIRTLSR